MYKLIVCDIHGTLMPESLRATSTADFRAQFFQNRNYATFLDRLRVPDRHLVLLSGGGPMEITANLEYLGLKGIVPITLLACQGAMSSTDYGASWQVHLPELSTTALELRRRFEIVYNELKTYLEESIAAPVTVRVVIKELVLICTVHSPAEALRERITEYLATCLLHYQLLADNHTEQGLTLTYLLTVHGNTKAAAINRLLAHHKLQWADVLFYGNGGNDVSAIEGFTSLISQTHSFPSDTLSELLALPTCKGLANAAYYKGLIPYL